MALSELLAPVKEALEAAALALDAKEVEIKAESEQVGFDKGVASVHIPETPVGEGEVGFSQEQVDKIVADAVAAALAGVPVDTTPFSQEDLDKAVADALAAQLPPVVDASEEVKKLQEELAVKDAKIVELSDKISAFDADLAALEAEDVKQVEDLRAKYKGV